MVASNGSDETARLRALGRYHVLDTPKEQDFDDIADLAAEICETPIAVVNLIGDGRQFFKAEVGLGVRETPLESSFCRHALLETDFLYVPDATKDPRFECNPLVTGEPGLRFYAGALLRTPDGHPIGTVCVLDLRPRELSEQQQRALQRLARQAMAQLELRRALSEQREVQVRQRQILDSATDYAIMALDMEGRITDWSKGAENVLGWSETDALGRSGDIIFLEEDCAAGLPAREMETARREGAALDERWHVRKGGERFWAVGEMQPMRQGNGEQIGYLKILRDRTEQKEQAERLKQSEERLGLALGAAGMVGTWDWDLKRDVIYADPNFARIYTVDPDWAARGAPLTEYTKNFHPEDVPSFELELGKLLSGQQETFTSEYRVVQPDGSCRWLYARGKLVRDQDGTPVRFPGATVDLTELKEAERRVLESERRFRQLTELSPGIVWMGHQDGSLSYLNDYWYAYTGQSPEEALPTGWASVIHPEDLPRLEAGWSKARRDVTIYDMEARLRRQDGEYRWFLMRALPLRDADGSVSGWLGTDIDIQDRKEAEQRQDLLTRELEHRVKNTLALVQAIAAQTFRNATDLAAAREAFSARLVSLGQAHDILVRTSWTATPIADLVRGALSVHRQGGTSRIRASGPDLTVAPKAALSLTMALHELATNATKYGALSTDDGRIDLRWHVLHGREEPFFCLTWAEHGGPPVSKPTRRGFGSRLIERSFVAEVGGKVHLEYQPTGVVCRIEAPLAAMQEHLDSAAA
jgi:PAS domain S-box-containing protein